MKQQGRATAKRVLVTGGGGFIGANLIRRLVDSHIAVRCLDQARATSLPLPEVVDLKHGDFTHPPTLADCLRDVDAVVHLATATTPKTGTDAPGYDVSQNLVGTIKLLEACVSAGVRRLVFVSSGGTVYGRPLQPLISEEHPLDPLNSYGIVKLAIEKYLGMYRHFGTLDPVVLRVSNPFGPGQATHAVQGVIAVALGALKRNEPFMLWGDGSPVRDFLYVDDLSNALHAAIELDTRAGWVFNIGSGHGHSIKQVLDACQVVARHQLTIISQAGRAIDVPANVLDVRRAAQVLDWRPAVSLEEGLARTWAWVLKHG